MSFFADLALALRDLRLEMVAHPGEQVAGDVELLGDADERVVRVPEELLDLRREELVVTDLDPAVEDAADGPRRGHLAVVEEAVAHLAALSDLRRLEVVDLVLEPVDLRVHGVE